MFVTFFGARLSILSRLQKFCKLKYMSIYSVRSYVHNSFANADCNWYVQNDKAGTSCGVMHADCVSCFVFEVLSVVTLFTECVNCSLQHAFARMIFASIKHENCLNSVEFFGFGWLHVEHAYFHTPCTHVRFGLHVMHAYGFFPCSHPPVQATHRRLNRLCSHTSCGLHLLQLALL